jgi:broad specificity phosphatase PhoE
VTTTTIILVRHALYDGLADVLVGRGDARLNARGRQQAKDLADHLAQYGIARVISSPQLRARQTAEPIGETCRLPVETAADFNELDYGAWSGRSFAELHDDPRWRGWNEQRATAQPPGGESMGELQARVRRGLKAVAAGNPPGPIVIVSHAEPIRAAVLHWRGLDLDQFACVQIEPASMTVLHLKCPKSAQWTDLDQAAVPA